MTTNEELRELLGEIKAFRADVTECRKTSMRRCAELWRQRSNIRV